MIRYTSNPPSRQIAPVPVLIPSHRRAQMAYQARQARAAHIRFAAHPILEEIDAYLAECEMTAGGFGRMAAGQFDLVRRLRLGEQPDDATVAKVRAFFAFVGWEG